MGCCFPCFSAVTKEEEGKLVQNAQSDPIKGKDGLFPPPTNPWLPTPQHPPPQHHHHQQQQQQQHPPPQIHQIPQPQPQQHQQLPPQQQNPNKLPPAPSDRIKPKVPFDEKKESEAIDIGKLPIGAHTFTFRELALATKNFRSECFLGEGGFGRVYKGCLESTGQIVAVKQLDRNGLQGNREFLVEVLMLSLLHHTNLVNLIGYCADGDQRLLVYEYMSLGSLEDHLHDLPQGKEPLEWSIRMKIAAGAAKGLEYLHDKANPPVIYRDLKCSNILLDETFHPKLSDFGLAKLGPVGDKSHVSTRVMGTYGYCAPEYAMTGQLTVKSDVYSFGVVLLELITGRRAIDNCRKAGEQNLVSWARPLFKDRKKFPQMADPALKGRYPVRGLYQALAVAAMCLQEEATARPVIGDVVTALSYLASQTHDPALTPAKGGATGKEKKESDMKVEGGRDAGMGGLDEAGHKLFKQGLPGSPRDKDPPPLDTLAKDSSAEYTKDNLPSEGRNHAAALLTDRERAVAEARSWGESWREKMRGSTRAGFDDP